MKLFIMAKLLWFLLMPLVPIHAYRPDSNNDHCPTVSPGMLNVHLVPHSHVDVGWLKTMEQNYFGIKQAEQKTGVQYIIEAVISELRSNSERRFVWAETAHLWKWWKYQAEESRIQLFELVQQGRLEIVNGGWSINDEATTHYQAIIDQFTLGFRRLVQMFGQKCPRPYIGWMLSNKGHSHTVASLMSQFGFDGLFFEAVDYQDMHTRLQSKNNEFIWATNPNLGQLTNIFTSILANHYTPPKGFCFDVSCTDDPIIDDNESREYNVKTLVSKFINYIQDIAKVHLTDNILVPMGGDFFYQMAHVNFINLDKLIRYVNMKQQSGDRVKVMYSTPSCYLKAVNSYNTSWKTKKDDFFPYASKNNTYFTGFYSSRPNSKKFERIGNHYLQICKQLHTLAKLTSEHDQSTLDPLKEAMGVMESQYGITGTSRKSVVDNYHYKLHRAMKLCEIGIRKSLGNLTPTDQPQPRADTIFDEDCNNKAFPISSCFQTNMSQCNASESCDKFVVTLYNPLGHHVTHPVRIPVPGNHYIVQDANGDELITQLVPIPILVRNLLSRTSAATYEIVFLAENLPSLGFKSYYVTKQNEVADIQPDTDNSWSIGNGGVQVEFDEVNGQLKEFIRNGEHMSLKHNLSYYTNDPSNSGGAYIFRPSSPNVEGVNSDCAIHTITYKGDIVEEVHQSFASWLSQVVRVYKKENHAEIEWMVGPIPVDDKIGKDVVSRFSTNLKTNRIFYTDANGREMVKRERGSRSWGKSDAGDEVAANYYPVTTNILIQDLSKRLELAVVTDRAQGGTSLRDGELELMVHRRLVEDDDQGINESLDDIENDEGIVARGLHYIIGGKMGKENGSSLSVHRKELVNRKLMSPWMFVTCAQETTFDEWRNTKLMEFRGIKKGALPRNVHLLTLEPWKSSKILLRLENFLDANDDYDKSDQATVNLQDLFTPFIILSVHEMTLGANMQKHEMQRLNWMPSNKVDAKEAGQHFKGFKVGLKPMEIRTFVLEIQH